MNELMERIKELRRAIGVTVPPWMGLKDWEIVGCALESIATDEQTREAGLWQGDLIPRAIQALEKLIEQHQPIPVSERLPEDGERVLLFVNTLRRGKVWIDAYFDSSGTVNDVTHWLPLPPKPE